MSSALVARTKAGAAPGWGRRAASPAVWLNVLPVLTLVVAVLLWQLVVSVGDIPAFVLPKPTEVAGALGSYHSLLLEATWSTLLLILTGFAISVIAGVLLGLAIAFSRILERILFPLLVADQAVPKIAVAPLFLAWFGFGSTSKILMAATIGFFPMVMQTVLGMRSISDDMVNLAKVTRAPGWRIFWLIRLPNALPSLFSGLKLCVSLSVIGVVVSEFVAGTSGLGYLIVSAQGMQQTDLAFAAIVCLTAVSLALFYLALLAEKVLVTR
jgi:NitT/TauT family transport system permease protein